MLNIQTDATGGDMIKARYSTSDFDLVDLVYSLHAAEKLMTLFFLKSKLNTKQYENKH